MPMPLSFVHYRPRLTPATETRPDEASSAVHFSFCPPAAALPNGTIHFNAPPFAWFISNVKEFALTAEEVLKRETWDHVRVRKEDREMLLEALVLYKAIKGVEINAQACRILESQEDKNISIVAKTLEQGILGQKKFQSILKVLLHYFVNSKDERARPQAETIIRHTYEKNKWNLEESTAQGHLLKQGRLGAIHNFGGRLPEETLVVGVPRQNKNATLTRWLNEEMIAYTRSLPPSQFYQQVKTLFVQGYHLNEEIVESWIVASVFEDQGWGQVKTDDEIQKLTPRERRLYEVRLLCARDPRHRGVITSVKRLSWEQQVHLKAWLDGAEIKYDKKFTPSMFYEGMKSLLLDEYYMAADLAEVFIVTSVFEDQGWGEVKTEAEVQSLVPEARLLYEVRLRCAQKSEHRGQIPRRSELPDMPSFRRESPFSKWLYRQHGLNESIKGGVRLVLIHLYHQKPEDVERLINATH